MRVKAIESFCGLVSMAAGQEGEIADKAILQDLLRCGYVEEVKEQKKEKKK